MQLDSNIRAVSQLEFGDINKAAGTKIAAPGLAAGVHVNGKAGSASLKPAMRVR